MIYQLSALKTETIDPETRHPPRPTFYSTAQFHASQPGLSTTRSTGSPDDVLRITRAFVGGASNPNTVRANRHHPSIFG
jgi:hypothetical protein